MQVTRQNVNEAYAEFARLLPTSKFCSVDLEMTGLYPANQLRGTSLDSVDERYKSMVKGSTDFTILQLGLCLTHEDPNDHSQYIYTPFNLYTWPQKFKNHPQSALLSSKSVSGGGSEENPSTLFLDIDAVEYNRDHSMDFQKWITEGIPYWKKKDLAKIEQYFTDSLLFEHHHQKGLMYGDHRQPFGKSFDNDQGKAQSQDVITNRALSSIRSMGWKNSLFEFSNQLNTMLTEHLDLYDALPIKPTPQVDQTTESTEDSNSTALPATLTLGNLTKIPHLTPRLFEDGPISFKLPPIPKNETFLTTTRQYVESQLPKDQSYIIRLDFEPIQHDSWNIAPTLNIYTPQQHLQRIEQKQAQYQLSQQSTLGANLFWEALKKHKTPLIVHNGMFDLLFCFSHFEDALPASFSSFRAKLAQIFPSVYDTKFIYNHPITNLLIKNKIIPPSGGNTALGTLYDAFEAHAVLNLSKPQESSQFQLEQISNDQNTNVNADITLDIENQPPQQKAPQFSIPPLRPAQLRPNYSDYAPDSSNPRYHEAGFDAYITSVVFAQLFHLITTFHRKYKSQFIQHTELEQTALKYHLKAQHSNPSPTTLMPQYLNSNHDLTEDYASAVNTFNSLFRSTINTMNSIYHFNLALDVKEIETSAHGEFEKYQNRLENDEKQSSPSQTAHKPLKTKQDFISKALGLESSKILKYTTLFDLKHDMYQPSDTSNVFVLINTTEELYFQKHSLDIVPNDNKYFRDTRIFQRPNYTDIENILSHTPTYSSKQPIFTPLSPPPKIHTSRSIQPDTSQIFDTPDTPPESINQAIKFKINTVNNSIFTIQCTPPILYHDLLDLFKTNSLTLFPNKSKTASKPSPHTYIDPSEWDIIPLHIYLEQRSLEFSGKRHSIQTPFYSNQTNSLEKGDQGITLSSPQSFVSYLTSLKQLSTRLFRQQCGYNSLSLSSDTPPKVPTEALESHPTSEQTTTPHQDLQLVLSQPLQATDIVQLQHDTYTMAEIEQFHNATSHISLLPSHIRKQRQEEQLKRLGEATVADRVKQYKHEQLSQRQRENEQKNGNHISQQVSMLLKNAGDTWMKHRPFILGSLLGAGTTAVSMYTIYQNSMGKIHTQAVSDLKYHNHPYFTQHNANVTQIQQYHLKERQAIAKRRLLAKKQAERFNQQKRADHSRPSKHQADIAYVAPPRDRGR